MLIEANFRNWNDSQHESMTNVIRDWSTEVRNQPLSHIVFRASKFPFGEWLNVGLYIIYIELTN